MARFDVYMAPDESGYLLNVQADLLSALNTRIVVPLHPLDQAPSPAERLNPEFEILGVSCSMVTPFMAAIPRSELRIRVASLDSKSSLILSALNFPHQGW